MKSRHTRWHSCLEQQPAQLAPTSPTNTPTSAAGKRPPRPHMANSRNFSSSCPTSFARCSATSLSRGARAGENSSSFLKARSYGRLRTTYYEDDGTNNYLGKTRILEARGYVIDVTPGNAPNFQMTEEFVALLNSQSNKT